MKKKVQHFTILLVVAVFIGILVNGLNGKATAANPGDMASDFTLKDVHGKEHKLSDYYGKVVVLNYFTTWCEPCLEEAPELEKFGTEYRGAELLIIAKGESSARINKYLDETGSSLTYLLDTKEETAKDYSVISQPETFIIDETGKIRERFSGPTTKKKLIEMIENLH